MLIGLRNAMFAGGGWRNPYVTDGLVAMRDAVWNVADRVHDPESLTWDDIVDGTSMTVNGTWGDDYLLCNTTGNIMQATYNYGDFEDVSMTLVYDTSNWNSMNWMVSGMNNYVSGEYEIDIHNGASSTSYASGNIRAHNNQAIVGFGWGLSHPRNSITVVKDGFEVRAYRGGTYVKSYTISSYDYTNKKFTHGMRFGGMNSRSYRYNGKLMHHRLYSRVLTADEIAANFAVDRARFNLPPT